MMDVINKPLPGMLQHDLSVAAGSVLGTGSVNTLMVFGVLLIWYLSYCREERRSRQMMAILPVFGAAV